MTHQPVLSSAEVDQFWQDGYLLLEDAVDTDQLSGLRTEFSQWVEESREYTDAYGEIMDGRARFDLDPKHSKKAPALRRVASPEEVSQPYYDTVVNSRALDAVSQLLGANIKFHHGKINAKQPGAATEVKFHQDFPFTPHTNDDLITVLFFVDEVTTENGPLEVIPGSHKGPIHGLWHDGVFTGAVSDSVAETELTNKVQCFGKAGSACLMHTRLLHGSATNLSDHPRTLFICVYSAEDAIALTPNPVPGKYFGKIVRGSKTGRVRCIEYEVDKPQYPKQTSFFHQQEAPTADN